MQTRIAKWGNSLGVRIPQALASSIGLSENTAVEISAEQDCLVIKPTKHKRSLRELSVLINDENRHDATDWDAAVGKEAW